MSAALRRARAWVAAGLAAAACGAAAVEVREVRVEHRGAVPVDEGFVRAHVATAPGRPFDRAALAADVRALQQTRRFREAGARAERLPDGIAVVFTVVAKPRLDRVEVSGADQVGNRRVAEELGLAVGDLADDADVAAAARKVQDFYLKKYFPDARLRWDLAVEPGTGLGRLAVTVREGARARVRAIRFTGCSAVPESELRAAMSQRRFRWYNPWHWVVGAGRLDADALEADREAIRRAYLDRGHLDVRVGEPEVRLAGRGALEVALAVTEGRVYRVRAVDLSGFQAFTAGELRAQVRLRPGDVASMREIDGSAQAVADYYGNRGYARTLVDPVLTPDASGAQVDVRFAVSEGRLTRLRDVRIRGNAVTRDPVIRRELTLAPGDLYSSARVRTGERRLMNLGYFAKVDSFVEDTGTPGEADLTYEVEEQSVGQAAAGVGFSSIDSLSTYLEISHGNFDLFHWPPVGDGQKARLRVTAGTKRTDFEISWTEPWFLDRRLSFGVDLFRHDKRYLSSDYDEKDTGGRISLGRGLGSHDRVTVSYGLQEIDIFNVSTNASDVIREEEGARTKSDVTVTLAHDTRDRSFVPTRGNRTTLSATLAGGPLGGETDLYDLELHSAQYVPLWFRHVLLLRGQAGVVEEYGGSDRVPIFDRYFLGGANTIRGFKFRDVGPYDANGDPIGGRSMAFASVEYTVPLYEKVRAAAFYDAGMVWPDAYQFEGDWNSSWGVGLRLDLPMLPLRLDYSWPLEAAPENDGGGRFSFWIGYGF